MKRLFALLLCAALCVTLIPAAYAGDIEIIDTEDSAVELDEPVVAPLPAADEPMTGGVSGLLAWSLLSDGTLIYSGRDPIRASNVGGTVDKEQVKTLIICEGIPSIYQYCFCEMPNLETAVIADSVTLMEGHVFENCPKLKNVVLSSQVPKINQFTFAGCSSLEQITIPASVKEIDEKAFMDCSSLKTIYFLGKPKIAYNAFRGVTATAYTPKTNSWSNGFTGGELSWSIHNGFSISITDLTGNVSCSVVQSADSYSGAVDCSLTCDENKPVIVVEERTVGQVKSYRALAVNRGETPYRVTLNVDQDVTLYITYKGDVNLDGILKASDGTMIKRFVLGTYSFKNVMTVYAADPSDYLDFKGFITASDGTKVARAVLGTYSIPW